MGLKKYNYNNKVFDILTISPNLLFYYRIQKPKSINMSNFATHIVFYDMSDNILYYNENKYAHWLFSNKNNKNEFVFWSKTGNELAIYEYERNSYYLTFINLLSKICYKFNLIDFEKDLYKDLDHGFDFNEIENLALKNKIHKKNLVINKLKCTLFNKWYP
jgi:hypothetical protein